MADDRTVLDHLLEARDALAGEVARLNEAIEQLDLVLARIGSVDRSLAGGLAAGGLSRPAATTGATVTAPVTREPVNRQADLETGGGSVAARRRGGAGRGPAKKAVTRSRRPGEAPKSIRVHVLDMLAEENREFGLAEIIDRVHDAGIQAHDDAVRSITIKLMKDGRVERVGRGQYRLARRGGRARSGAATATEPTVTQPDTDASESPDRSTQDTFAYPSQDETAQDETAQDDTAEFDPAQHAATDEVEEHDTAVHDGVAAPDEAAGPGDGADDQYAEHDPGHHDADHDEHHDEHHDADAEHGGADSGPADDAGHEAAQQPPEQSPGQQPWGEYTPPLNLGQPWQG